MKLANVISNRANLDYKSLLILSLECIQYRKQTIKHISEALKVLLHSIKITVYMKDDCSIRMSQSLLQS